MSTADLARPLPRSRGVTLSVTTVVAIAILWEVFAHLSRVAFHNGLVPTWEQMFTSTWASMSDYWTGGLGLDIATVSTGGERSWALGALALLSNSLATLGKLLAGLIGGCVTGVLGGLLATSTRWSRRLVSWPAQVLRTFPLLALVTLFQLWFGTAYIGAVVFVAVAVAAVTFTGSVNAINNLPPLQLANARLLGANRLQLVRDVILPGMFAELRSAITLAIGLGWTALIGAELVGSQEGLGWIIVSAQYFGHVDRMLLVGLLIMLYALLTSRLFDLVADKVLSWKR